MVGGSNEPENHVISNKTQKGETLVPFLVVSQLPPILIVVLENLLVVSGETSQRGHQLDLLVLYQLANFLEGLAGGE